MGPTNQSTHTGTHTNCETRPLQEKLDKLSIEVACNDLTTAIHLFFESFHL